MLESNIKLEIIQSRLKEFSKLLLAEHPLKREQPLGLFDGRFGNLFFLSNFLEYDDSDVDNVQDFLSDILSDFSKGKLNHTFSNGLSGILSLAEYLKVNDIVEIEFPNLPELVDHLSNKLSKDINEGNFDYFHGALGIGKYFHITNNRSDVLRIVEFLKKIAIKANDPNEGVFWESFDVTYNKKGTNISLSHGIPSILRFLCVIHTDPNYNLDLSELISDVVKFIFTFEWDCKIKGSYFPNNSKSDTKNSRLAWCYGDLGIAYATWKAGLTLGNPEITNRSLEILLHSTKRISYEDTFIHEAGLCHGSAGVATIYRRIYLDSKIEVFKSAYEFWLNKTLELTNFNSFSDLDKSAIDRSFLNGISGIGMLLLSHLNKDNQLWDEFLMLS